MNKIKYLLAITGAQLAMVLKYNKDPKEFQEKYQLQ